MKITPQTDRIPVAPASKTGSSVGRAVLENLTTTTLYKLLKLKNIPLRSKLRKKKDRIEALRGSVTAEDLVGVGINTTGMVLGPVVHPGALALDVARDTIHPGDGKRLDVPVAGIDVHADFLWVAIATMDGITWSGKFNNTRKSIEDMALVLIHHDVAHIAMESTAEYWLKPCWGLEQAGIQVLVANAKQVAATQGKKTDRLDARRLALAFRDGRLKPSILCTPQQFRMRKLNRDATKKTQNASSAITRAKRILKHHDAPGWLMDVSGSVRARRVLDRIFKPGARGHILRIITEEYAKYSGKIDNPEILAGMARETVEFLDCLVDDDERIRLCSHLDDYKHFQVGAVELQNSLLAMVRKDEKLHDTLKLLVTLPCVSTITALTFLVEVVDIRFFWRGESLVKWAGMAPRVNQSGVKKRSTGKIYKGGNKWVRAAAFQVAKTDYCHAKHQGHPIGRFVDRLYHGKKKPYKKAVIAGGAKLLRYMYHVLALEKPFQEIYADEECEKLKDNRERKLKALDKQVKNASLSDLLERVAARLEKSSARLDRAMGIQIELLSSMMLDMANALDFG